jgi:hypothetical protein
MGWALIYVAVVFGLLYILTFAISNYWLNIIVGFLTVGLIIALVYKIEALEERANKESTR